MHNHPSGKAEPSEADIEITKRIRKVAKMLDLQFFEHIVIGDNSFQSIK